MDNLDFDKQADELVEKAMQYPGLQIIRCYPFLKLYLFSENNIEWEIVIYYHIGYRVPVMYFRCRNLILAFYEVMDQIKQFKEFITPEELPTTGQPFYVLHPCRSKELLDISGSLLSWLSITLQAIGVSLPLSIYIQ
ncbi:unnamed protein product [Blepharisma stoltei]|uniref:Ubiquitin-like-conjugating enzyme ATG10 n=1 Tax=Blepharisma stoltei TaxID=1481888 RepID=A0AAU9IHR8_9CILI|nr:unnamed protein product [Blepharisma stoltei]